MNILYLTFYFDPDIGPGAFRNTTLVNALACQLTSSDSIHVLTTQPNRYDSYKPVASEEEEWCSGGCPITVQRIAIPKHKSGFIDQICSFFVYYVRACQLARAYEYDLVFASSSRLFTAFLGARLARKRAVPLFLDIRDLFREAILDVIKNPLVRMILSPLLRAVERYTFGYARHINLVSEGFRSYFDPFRQATYSYFTNGIDTAFLGIPASQSTPDKPYRTILYAGNIGEGQGLHDIIPEAARQLGSGYRFLIIGDGGARIKLEVALKANDSTNVKLRQPVNRRELLAEYQDADYMFVHLNNIDACRRVLPSKLFEYGATDKPIIAGVTGYAASFVRDYLPNSILFNPGDVTSLIRQLRETPYQTQSRAAFRQRFRRQTINAEMASQIRGVLESVKFVQEPVTNVTRNSY
ncbi:glycosyltransferase family 4 protein [Spirosoma sp. KCTC 42546]|uniref:glycosyltransferase family 4 protein n=1 Tax=Spirosoma sp. KCTC 42546 TaxID=2520506 RepID=UPI00115A0883|nr:glycosyltransferase family 4 protein [Spirosoma sp. KCTC 42546]QDK82601.1 glycosyltransferase family 4 protein [Spirosoma sp. KCTC 42546]